MNTSAPETAKEAARRLSAPMLDKGFKPAGLHAYTDVDGNPIFYRIRCKHPETLEKWIRPIHKNGNGFEMGEPKFQNGKPLYALHRIANNPEAIVWITEGEQKVNALNKLGLVATTSGGATSADTTDWKPLRRKTIKIFPDYDDAGKSYAGTVANILLSMGCTVSCVDVDKLGLGIGDDVIQWLEAHPGATAVDIEALPVLLSTVEDSFLSPEPLPSLPDVKAFDYAYLPPTLCNYVKDISERMQCPADFAAVGVLVMIAAIIGRKVGIRPMKHNDWIVIPNLWGALIGNSGIMKSPTQSETLSPIKKLQALAFEEFNNAKADHEIKAELIKIQKSIDKSKARKAVEDSKVL